MTTATVKTMPDVRRTDATAVFVSTWYVPDPESRSRLLGGLGRQWRDPAGGAGIVSASSFVSVAGDTILAYVQCADPAGYRRAMRSTPGAVQVGAVEYRLRRCVVCADGAPGCVVVATFDVDGPDRQAHIVDAIVDAIEQAPPDGQPGLLAANFHVSVDGSRVLNYAEWTTDEAHETFLAGSTRATALRISTTTPGVRPIGFTRYHLHESCQP
ncbi:antibiotic biosynthesis monooxygenase [Micromonospora sp. HM5-17]|jgi:hypothetical protein|uniref:antibiotic biosynthesis monooxygenase n=1 Tax=Micromonospora sp. HM5-17 TaxID=2487710 RepID=UPI000F489E76|nr:antibiotic biosynthesis monooxygenase [Micromonospora sp. HM5-17]ROT33855.1 hypothetical protein EF879_02855 [Micromonospora sp. HM5-17]